MRRVFETPVHHVAAEVTSAATAGLGMLVPVVGAAFDPDAQTAVEEAQLQISTGKSVTQSSDKSSSSVSAASEAAVADSGAPIPTAPDYK
jgi:hypothetical protein